MTDPFLAEVRIFSGTFAPTGWALCHGQLLPIAQNTALFSLLGTTYGGNGQSTFALPDLRGATPLQPGQGAGLSPRYLGEAGGSAAVPLLSSEMPVHSHPVQAVSSPGSTSRPDGAQLSAATFGRAPVKLYQSGQAPDVAMSPLATAATGGGQPHENRPPFLCLTFIIALQGIFPQHP